MIVPPSSSEDTLLDLVWASIVNPGASPTLIATINVVLAVLIFSLAYFCTTYVYSPHLIAMVVLALLLLVSFNVFVSYSGVVTAHAGGKESPAQAQAAEGEALAQPATTAQAAEGKED
jgi:hypothetical protein